MKLHLICQSVDAKGQKITPSPGLRFIWSRYDLRRSNYKPTELVGNNRTIIIKSSSESSQLQLFNTTSDDTGVYRCRLGDESFDCPVIVIGDMRKDLRLIIITMDLMGLIWLGLD